MNIELDKLETSHAEKNGLLLSNIFLHMNACLGEFEKKYNMQVRADQELDLGLNLDAKPDIESNKQVDEYEEELEDCKIEMLEMLNDAIVDCEEKRVMCRDKWEFPTAVCHLGKEINDLHVLKGIVRKARNMDDVKNYRNMCQWENAKYKGYIKISGIVKIIACEEKLGNISS